MLEKNIKNIVNDDTFIINIRLSINPYIADILFTNNPYYTKWFSIPWI